MADREKIIKAIETHLSTDISVGCDDCTYDNDELCTTRLLADILALLLKEQEAVPPEREYSGGGRGFTWWHVCGACRVAINPNDKYCHECGRPVKWE